MSGILLRHTSVHFSTRTLGTTGNHVNHWSSMLISLRRPLSISSENARICSRYSALIRVKLTPSIFPEAASNVSCISERISSSNETLRLRRSAIVGKKRRILTSLASSNHRLSTYGRSGRFVKNNRVSSRERSYLFIFSTMEGQSMSLMIFLVLSITNLAFSN